MALTDEQLKNIIDNMSKEQLDEFLTSANELETSRAKNPLIHVVPHDSQETFLRLDKKEVFFFGANSAGKSFIGAYKAACYLTGGDPLGMIPHEIPSPQRMYGGIKIYTKLWMGCVKLEKGVEIIKQNLLPLLPPDSHYPLNETKGLLKMKAGPELQCYSYGADTETWQADALDGAWLDEQCPWDKYRELRARVARRDGRIWSTMTPLYGNSSWTYWEIYKKAETGENPDVGYCIADIEDNIYLTDAMKQRLYTAYEDTDEAAARLHGKFMLMQGTIHPHFNPESHIIEPYQITDYHLHRYNLMRIFDLHPRQPSVMSFAMWRDRPREIVVFDELSMPGGILNMFDFKLNVHRIAERHSIKGNITNILDSPDPSSTNPGPGMEDKRHPVTLLTSLAVQEKAGNKVVPGITGIPANRDRTSGIKRFNDHLIEPGCFSIFNTCKNHIFSIENYRWDDWIGKLSYEKPLKEEPVKKFDHEVRNMHFLCMHLPALNMLREELEQERAHPKYGTSYTRNYQRAAFGGY